MKGKKLATLILTALLMLSILPMSVFAEQGEVTASSTASITINSAVENDVLAAYKVVDITYVAETNTLTYKWNSDFADYFDGKTPYNKTLYTVEQFDALKDDSDDLKTLLAGLPKYISEKNIAPVGSTQTVAADKTATFANLAMGEYFIRPTSTTSVYQLMLQKLEPTVSGGKYVIDDLTFSAKHEEVSVDKAANKTSVTKKEKVTYTIKVDIPTYATGAVDKSFYVSDLLPDGLAIDTDSIKVKRNGTDITSAAGTQYTLDTTATNDYTFKLSVSKDQYAASWSENGGKQLVITYTATLNDNDTTAVNTKETNTVTFDYSNYPYVENSHAQKTDTVDVTTFAIKIDKYVDGNESTKLAGAKFDLYRTATQAEIDAGTAVTIPHTSVNGIKLESGLITDADGAATFAKYEANGTNYDYYLVETQAPSGYNLLDNAVKVNFADTDVAATAGVYTVKVPNSSGIQLPITGGTGTVIFTVIGIALMVGAVVLFVASRKKTKAKESK
ncbi:MULTISPECIES: SpaH/EbpB family LPXTG-anchored major pilin [unclassified Candidatus Paralachnospira]|uniref:SpaH/EbpB family LPXTG-anchored major pilin n=1 Tax=unclassified Candidatus Paralachnospira TaxID=3099471 RepID=UPI003F92CB49